VLTLRSVDQDYDPRDRDAAYIHLRKWKEAGEVATGVLYIEERSSDMHAVHDTVEVPLVTLSHDDLCPGGAALARLMDELR
jgi:2-oxoglutarate ferredoxin oxidoreductase subunit beta